MKKYAIVLLLILLSSMAYAYGPATINPNLPAQNSPLSSSVVRNNFAAAYNDVTSIFNLINSLAGLPSFLGPTSTNTSPSISGDPTTGFYTSSPGRVDLSISGTKTVEWSSTGENIVNGVLNLNTPLDGASGGTGVNNSTKTITLGGNLTTSGAFNSTFTMTGTTNVTFPTSGTLSTTTGTVTSVAATGDGTVLNSAVTGSPITSTGTLAFSLANAGAKTVLGNTTAGSATPTYTSSPVVSGSMTANTLVSTVATGTAPLTVASTTQVANLNAATAGSATTATTATNVATVSTTTNASYFPLFVASSSNSNQPPNLGTGLTFNPSTNNLTTTTFTGALSGNATTATTATNATNTAITDDTTTNATMYPTWVTAATGNLPQKVSSTKLSFNPSTGALTSTSFSGALSGNATTATTLQTARAIGIGGSTGLTATGVNFNGSADINPALTGTLNVANGGTGITSGTSGGVLAFTASGTIASSSALTANLPVIGGGAGVAPTVGTRSGNTTSFATTSGSLTSAHIAAFDVNGNIVDGGVAPVSAVPGCTFLVTNSPSASATTTFSSTYITSTYPKYIVNYTGFITTDSGDLGLLLSTNNGSSYLNSGYLYWGQYQANGSATFSGTAGSGPAFFKVTINGGSSATASQPDNGWVEINTPSSAARQTFFSHGYAAGTFYIGAGVNTGTTAVNNIQFYDTATGNLTGTFSLYGCK